MLRVGTVAAIPIQRNRTRRCGEGNKLARVAVNTREPACSIAAYRIVTARIENDDVKPIVGRRHGIYSFGGRHGLVLDLLFAPDSIDYWYEVILALHLKPMPGEEEEPYTAGLLECLA